MNLRLISLLLIVLFSCQSEETIVLPNVQTNNPTNVTTTSSTLSGTLTEKGTRAIADHGFIWSLTSGVSETNGIIISLGTIVEGGPFESVLNELSRGKAHYYVAYIKVGNRFFLGEEIEFIAGAHTITSVSPNPALAGDKITITGTDFIADTAQVNVTIGGRHIKADAATETQIEITLPFEISGGSKSVKVEIDDIEVSSSSNLIVTPFLEELNPAWGFPGDTVELSGSGFGNTSEVAVKINGSALTVISATYNKIRFIVPTSTGGTKAVSLLVNSIAPTDPISLQVLAWKKLMDLPFDGRYASISFIINNKLYVGMGSTLTNDRMKDFWEVDLQSGVATQLKDFPEDARFGAQCFTINGKGYMVLGHDSTTALLNELWEYAPSNDSWSLKAPFPGGLRSLAISFVLNGKAYVGNGFTSDGTTSLNDFYQYDPELNSWSSIEDFGGGPMYGQGSFVIDGNAYLIGGVKNNETIVREVWLYDGANWIQRADYPGQLVTDGYGFNYDNIGCFGFGWVDSNNGGLENWKYKPSSNTWKKVQNFSGPDRFGAVSGSSEKYWYVGLGYLGNTHFKDLWIVELQ